MCKNGGHYICLLLCCLSVGPRHVTNIHFKDSQVIGLAAGQGTVEGIHITGQQPTRDAACKTVYVN